jgi:aspartyl-tRNA(Asn)/glutamyl-tRNA(Gln) amidotransferase subunit A
MTSIDLKTLTIPKARVALDAGEFTSVALTQAYREQIAAKDKDVHAYLEVFDDALDSAKEADVKIAEARMTKKPMGVLTGIPCAIKDVLLYQDHISSAASKIIENYKAAYDGTTVSRLKHAGAVILGRTNTDEFTMGSSTETSAFGVTKNPHDLTRVAGGSSGGSAAAVAMDGALFALGTDTGGSIRGPSSFCGIVGLKPTYGAVSRSGEIAMASSLDVTGPMAKTVTECEIVFNVITGKDAKDGTTFDERTYGGKVKRQIVKGKSEVSNSKGSDSKMTIGVPRDFLKGDGIDPAVLQAFEKALGEFKAKGYTVKDIKLPNIAYSLPVYYILAPAEISANMARFDGVRYGMRVKGADGIQDYFETRRAGLGREVIRRILLGTYVLSSGYYDAYYNRANAVRRMITEDFTTAYSDVDIIAMPTTPGPAFKIGEKSNDPLAMYLEDIFTVTANLTGLPALSVPMGTKKVDGIELPLGIQLVAPHGAENTLFAVGKDFCDERVQE